MRKLLLTLLVATIFAVPDAHADFKGILKSGVQTTINLSRAS